MFPIVRRLRYEEGLSQGDEEDRTGLLRCYISRVENGYTVPSLETLQRFAGALGVPLYRPFYVGEQVSPPPPLAVLESPEKLAKEDGEAGEEARFLLNLRALLTCIAHAIERAFQKVWGGQELVTDGSHSTKLLAADSDNSVAVTLTRSTE